MDLFDLLAPLYDRVLHFSDPSQLLELLELDPAHRLLDVGGGTGRVTDTLTAYVERACIVDVSHGMLARARDKQLCAYRGAAERLPFHDGAFDRILVVDAFHHFRDWSGAAAELLRVLHPGGRLVIEEPDIRYTAVKGIALAERLLLMRSRFYAPTDLARLFEAAGGRVRVQDNGAGVYWAIVER